MATAKPTTPRFARMRDLAEVADAAADALVALRAEVAVLRKDMAALRSALAVDDGPVRRALEALAVERVALDELAADAPRLTGSELQSRLDATRHRLCALDATLR